jgi:hypothetical protein
VRVQEVARKAGTPVTPETWAAWFERFRADEALAKAKAASAAEFKSKGKLTGRQWFESGKGASLNTHPLTFSGLLYYV